MKRYLGIDFGDRYIGLALADAHSIALPYKVVEYDDKTMPLIQKIIASESITDLVVGWPISLSGAENERTQMTTAFIERLTEAVDIPCHRMDERLTSAAAKKKQATGRVDAIAATDILQTYLDAHGQPRGSV
jgi:putative holliday junction resolvase